MRRTIVRYLNLSFVLTLRLMCLPVKKRFPSLAHLVEAGILTEGEKKIIDKMDAAPSTNKHPKYWVPLVWAGSVITRARKEQKIKDDFGMKMLLEKVDNFRGHCGSLLNYDWVNVPLVYTQVVTLAVYTFLMSTLMGHQYLDPAKEYENFKVDLYFPIFTFLQFFFYMGWLKVAETLINPFGEDDDDFEMNWMIDRNLQVSYLIVDEMHMEHPELIRDHFWDNVFPEMPYTAAAEETRVDDPRIGAASHFRIPQNASVFLPTNDDDDDINESDDQDVDEDEDEDDEADMNGSRDIGDAERGGRKKRHLPGIVIEVPKASPSGKTPAMSKRLLSNPVTMLSNKLSNGVVLGGGGSGQGGKRNSYVDFGSTSTLGLRGGGMLADKGGSRPSLASSVYQRLRRGLGSSNHSLASQQRRRRRRSTASSTQRNPTSGLESRASCASPSEDPNDNEVFKMSQSEASSSLSSLHRSESDYSLQDRGCGGRGGGGGGQHVNRSLSRRSTAAKAELMALMRSANRTTSIHPLRGVRSDNVLTGLHHDRDREHHPHPHLLRRGVTALSFRNPASMSSSEHIDAAAARSVNKQLRQRLQALQSAQSEVIRLLDKEILLEDAANLTDPVEIVGALEERTEMLRRQLKSRNVSESANGVGEESMAAEEAPNATTQCQQSPPFSTPRRGGYEPQQTDLLAAQDGSFENQLTPDTESAAAVDLAKRLLTAKDASQPDIEIWHGYESEVADISNGGGDAAVQPLEPKAAELPPSGGGEEMPEGTAAVVDVGYGTELTTIEEQPELGYQSDSSETEALLPASATTKTKHKSDLTTVEESEESAPGSSEQLPSTVMLDPSPYSEKAV